MQHGAVFLFYTFTIVICLYFFKYRKRVGKREEIKVPTIFSVLNSRPKTVTDNRKNRRLVYSVLIWVCDLIV